jgi:hypothetical protein
MKMNPTTKKTLLQLFREFRIPLTLAIVWTVYAQWDNQFSLKTVIAVFGPAFFLASWMTGQLFRVRKQAGVESSFEKLESRLEHLVARAEEQTKEMINHVTGGDGYCSVMTTKTVDGRFSWIISYLGTYPLYNVTMRITDLERMRTCIDRVGRFDQDDFVKEIHLGDFTPGSFRLEEGHAMELEGFSTRSLNIYTTARNGYTHQEVRLMKVEDNWIVANRIMRGGQVVYEMLPEQFPVGENGKYDWDQSNA